MVALSDDLDKAQRSVVRLTWALLVLTLVLAVIGVAQFVATYQAPPIVPPAAVQSNGNETVGGSIPAHVVLIGRDSIKLPKAQWAPMVNEQPTVAENFEAVDRKLGHAFAQVLTIFKLPMSDDRKVGVQISREEYVEAFVVHPGKVTIQVRVDRGRYWLLSRETFDLQAKLSVDITRYRPQLPGDRKRAAGERWPLTARSKHQKSSRLYLRAGCRISPWAGNSESR